MRYIVVLCKGYDKNNNRQRDRKNDRQTDGLKVMPVWPSISDIKDKKKMLTYIV